MTMFEKEKFGDLYLMYVDGENRSFMFDSSIVKTTNHTSAW